MQEQPLILTLKLDEESQAFFNALRKLNFPPERNFMDAHLMLFHQLPDEPGIYDHLAGLQLQTFNIQVTGLMNLGAGVAYRVDSPQLRSLHKLLSVQFREVLILQDRQGFRPHITIMNKRTPEAARELLKKMESDFRPFTAKAIGLDLWTYLGGPWRHEQTYFFLTK